MLRPLRIEFPGAIYHVTARGDARGAIVRDDADRDMFLNALGEVVTRFGWLCDTYCLMNNHYHQFTKTRPVAQRRYAEFVAQGRNLPSPWPELKGQVLLGSDAFWPRCSHCWKAREHSRKSPVLNAGRTSPD